MSDIPPKLEMDLKERVENYFKYATKEQIDADLKKSNFNFWNVPQPHRRGCWNGINFIWNKVYGLGFAFERPLCFICSDDMKLEWREVAYKLSFGPIYLFGSLRVTPKRPCFWGSEEHKKLLTSESNSALVSHQ